MHGESSIREHTVGVKKNKVFTISNLTLIWIIFMLKSSAIIGLELNDIYFQYSNDFDTRNIQFYVSGKRPIGI